MIPQKRNSTWMEKLSHHSFLCTIFIRHSRLGSFLATMAEGQMNLFRQAVRNMLAALRMPDVNENELHDLTLRIGHTGKLREPTEL